MTSTTTEPTKVLPPRRAAFVREYLGGLNASRAARDVGYATKSASVEGSRLLANPEVQAEITRQQAVLAEQSNVTPEKIVAELAVIAFSNLGDYIKVVNGIPQLDLKGIDPSKLRAIASVKHDANGTTIKLHDKHAALVTLARTLGMIQDGSTNVLIQTHDSEKMRAFSLEDMRKALDSGVFEGDSLDSEGGDGLRENRTPSEASERAPSLSGETLGDAPPTLDPFATDPEV